jgi:prolyl-tRNA editing enzyme YbaK/EbsC (Cys-tRNA(Pro) deacylase)
MESLTSRDVQDALNALDLSITVHTYEVSTATAELAAEAIGCELGQIIKSLAFILTARAATSPF